MLEKICAPALLYIAFSLTHVIIDTIKGLYNTAMTKFLVMIVFSGLLNILCKSGLTIISWIVVFIPFITMSIITTIVLFTFGLSPDSGKVKREKNKVVVSQTAVKETPEYNKESSLDYESVNPAMQYSEIHSHTHNNNSDVNSEKNHLNN